MSGRSDIVSTNIILSIRCDMHSLLGENSSSTIEPVIAIIPSESASMF